MHLFGREDSKMEADRHSVSGPAGMLFVFGPFRLFPRQRLMTKAGKPVHLGSRAFDILVALLERPGELVSKEELMARVWPNTFVAPANLTVHISALRRALGDDRGHRYVVNTPGRGYHFVAPVTVETDLPSDAASVAPTLEQNLPTLIKKPAAHANVADSLAQQVQGHLLAILDRTGFGQPTADLAALEKLLRAHENSVLVFDLGPKKF